MLSEFVFNTKHGHGTEKTVQDVRVVQRCSGTFERDESGFSITPETVH